MKLTWHIVIKDLRRLRLPLALWVCAFLLEFAVGLRLLNGSAFSFASFNDIQTFDLLLFAPRAAIGYLLVAALIFDDPLVGTTAFWPTRPISGARLMGAKLLAALLIFGLLPILVTLPWWLYCGYGGQQVLEASLDSLKFEAAPVAAGFMIAALTGTMAWFLAWTLFAVTVVAMSFVLFIKPATTHLFFHGMDVPVDPSGLTEARLHTLYLLAVAGCAVVVALQFLTRRWVRTLILLAGMSGLLLAEAVWWPLVLRGRSEEGGGFVATSAVDSAVAFHHEKGASLHIEQDPGAASGTIVFGNLEVKGAPPELLLRYGKPLFEWRWPDGSHAQALGTLLGETRPSPYQLQMAAPHKELPEAVWEQGWEYKMALKNGKPLAYEDYVRKNAPANHLWDYYAEVPRPAALRMLSEPPECTIDVRGDVMKAQLSSEVPLASGSAWSGKGEGFKISQMKWNPETKMLGVFVVEHRAAIGGPFDPFGFSNLLNADSAYVAVNPRLGESAWPVYYSNFNFAIRIATVAIAWRSLTFIGPSNSVAAFPTLDRGMWTGPSFEDWFSGATLGRVHEVSTGSFSRKVTIERLRVEPDVFSKAP